MRIVLYYFVCSVTDWEKRPFFLAIGFAVSMPLLHHNRYYDIVNFQIDLVQGSATPGTRAKVGMRDVFSWHAKKMTHNQNRTI